MANENDKIEKATRSSLNAWLNPALWAIVLILGKAQFDSINTQLSEMRSEIKTMSDMKEKISLLSMRVDITDARSSSDHASLGNVVAYLIRQYGYREEEIEFPKPQKRK